jgi:hypothetical protein
MRPSQGELQRAEVARLYVDERGASEITGYSPAFFRKLRLHASGPPYWGIRTKVNAIPG